jgi:hypothetical protein
MKQKKATRQSDGFIFIFFILFLLKVSWLGSFYTK